MSTMRVPHEAASAALVRHRLLGELAGSLSGEVLDAAALVVSELVGNAVRHGLALPSGGLVARWGVLARDCGLRVEVVDGGAGPDGTAGAVQPAPLDAEGGRGLELVEALSTRWGSTPASPGTAVWAELSPEPSR